MLHPSAAPDRHASIDAIRGLAVMGILVMNVVGMAMPAYAYVDPRFYGGAGGADLAAWAVAFVLADGKMRALFTLLFGASIAIAADAAEAAGEAPERGHYRRMGWLLALGMIHAWLIWYGDILVEYAVVGAILFVARAWPPRALLFAAVVLLAAAAAVDLAGWIGLDRARAAALAPGAGAALRAEWAQFAAAYSPDPQAIALDLRLYRGGPAEVFAARAPMTLYMQTAVLFASLVETLGFAVLGLWLYRIGFLTGALARRTYAAVAAIGFGVAVPLAALVARSTIAGGFDFVLMERNALLALLLRPWIALAYAALVLLWLRAGAMGGLRRRVAAAGRMALSNYLGASLACTTLFYGYGGGLYGHLSRAELWWVILPLWAVMLVWSPLWLGRFRFGPAEWLWRSLARGTWLPLRRTHSPIAT